MTLTHDKTERSKHPILDKIKRNNYPQKIEEYIHFLGALIPYKKRIVFSSIYKKPVRNCLSRLHSYKSISILTNKE